MLCNHSHNLHRDSPSVNTSSLYFAVNTHRYVSLPMPCLRGMMPPGSEYASAVTAHLEKLFLLLLETQHPPKGYITTPSPPPSVITTPPPFNNNPPPQSSNNPPPLQQLHPPPPFLLCGWGGGRPGSQSCKCPLVNYSLSLHNNNPPPPSHNNNPPYPYPIEPVSRDGSLILREYYDHDFDLQAQLLLNPPKKPFKTWVLVDKSLVFFSHFFSGNG